MFNWLKKLTGRTGELSREDQALLQGWLSGLDHLTPGLGRRALNYVLTGAEESLPEQLAARGGGAEALKLYAWASLTGAIAPQIERDRFLTRPRSQDPELYVRVARLLEAAVRRDFPRDPVLGPEHRWIYVLVLELTQMIPNLWPRQLTASNWPWELVLDILARMGVDPLVVERSLYQASSRDYYQSSFAEAASQFAGLGPWVAAHPETIGPVLAEGPAEQRTQALRRLQQWRQAPAALEEQVLSCAVSSSKSVREAAGALLSLFPSANVRTRLEQLALSGKPDARCQAIAWLAHRNASECQSFFQQLLEDSPPEKVAQALRQVLAVRAPAPEEAAALPALSLPEPDQPLGEEARTLMERIFESGQAPAQGERPQLQESLDFMRRGGRVPVFVRLHASESVNRLYQELLGLSALGPVHFVRLMLLASVFGKRGESWWLYHQLDQPLERYLQTHPRVSLRELGAALQLVTGRGDLMARSRVLEPFGARLPLSDEQLWPYFSDHLKIVEMALDLKPGARDQVSYYDRPRARRSALEVLTSFPAPPPGLVECLWSIALSGSRAERLLAQKCLAHTPIEQRLLESLRHSRQEVRMAAADWVARRRLVSAVPALERALKSEKQEAVMDAFLVALEALGASLDTFLDRSKLEDLDRLPEALSWLALDRLPPVHWADTGQVVPAGVVTGFLVKSWKLKSPQPGALLRRYGQRLRANEREELGQKILEQWIAYDTRPAYTLAEARREAEQAAPGLLSWQPEGTTMERLVDTLTRNLMDKCQGSAIGDKGMLGAAGALGGSSLVALVAAYLKRWYGNRAAQCKALLTMLAWLEHPSAAQLLLAVATRFRTRGIQQEALRLVGELAERRQWTVEELADRTVGTAGLEDDGTLELDFGPRQITLRLGPGLELELWDGERRLKSLPDPRQGDDPELAAGAKKQLAQSRKELKQLLKEQPARLYAAMACQRSWSADDWSRFVLAHPITGRLAQRLLWTAWEGEERRATFRPLDDGSLTGREDEEICLQPGWQVRLAHALHLEPGESQEWARHLKDYKVDPLFPQVGQPLYRLPAELASARRLDLYKGFMLEAFKLRGRATKLGYSRGGTEDGGWFYTYRKLFSSLGVEAVIEFSGNRLPEENRDVALVGLSFQEPSPDSLSGGRERTLESVPAVLLSECWLDLKRLADEGPGFDPDWEKAVH